MKPLFFLFFIYTNKHITFFFLCSCLYQSMNYIKKKIAVGLHVPQLAEKAREKGIEQLNILEKKHSYFDQTLPPRRMTENERKKRMKKISRIANSLDNAIPHSPIPIGIDTILVRILKQWLLLIPSC